MGNKKNKYRQGKIAEIARLDFHDWTGRLLSRTRSKTTEKERGFEMISLIMNYFNLTVKDYEKFAEQQIIAEAYEQRNIGKLSEKKVFKPIQWTRNEEGKIISPFSKRI